MLNRIRFVAMTLITVFFLTGSCAADSHTLRTTNRSQPLPFQDTVNIWCEKDIEVCYQAGILEGTSPTSFSPNNPLSYAQIVVIASRIQDILSGGDGNFENSAQGKVWYQAAYESFQHAAQQVGKALPFRLTEAMSSTPSAPCLRDVFVETLAAALDISAVQLPSINDVKAVPDCYDETILTFYKAGIVTGIDQYGSFNAKGTLNRGQAAAMIARIISPELRKTLFLTPFDMCGVFFMENPETVLFTIDDMSFTVEQYAQEIFSGAIAESTKDTIVLSEQMEAGLRKFCNDYIVPELLAKSLNLELTEKDLSDIRKEAEAMDGYKGLSADYWYWRLSQYGYQEKLEAYYIGQYGANEWGKAPQQLNEDKSAILQKLLVKIARTEAFEDVSAKLPQIKGRIEKSGLKDLLNLEFI